MASVLFPMPLTLPMVLIAVVGVFLAGFVDGVAGGGGVISIPAYLIAGLPTHLALGTNKLSSCVGTAVSAGRFVRGGYVNWRLGLPSAALALFGAHLGTRLQLALDENYLRGLLLVILPLVAVVVLRERSLEGAPEPIEAKKQALIVLLAAFLIGGYDGFYGPGAGTFLLLAFCKLGRLELRTADLLYGRQGLCRAGAHRRPGLHRGALSRLGPRHQKRLEDRAPGDPAHARAAGRQGRHGAVLNSSRGGCGL